MLLGNEQFRIGIFAMDDTERLDRLNDFSQKFLKILKDDHSYFEEFHTMASEFRGGLLAGTAKVETEKPQKEFFKRLSKEIGIEEELLEALKENITCIKHLLKVLKTRDRIRWTEDLKKELKRLYIKEGRTALQIAEAWSVSLDTIESALKRFKIRKQDYQKKRQISLFPK